MVKLIIKETERGKVGLQVSGFILTYRPGTLEGLLGHKTILY